MEHAAEFRRCLAELDIVGIRRLWQHVCPHLPQPVSDDEALHTMHLARVQMVSISDRGREYSKAWLQERETRKVAAAVGIAIKAPPHRAARALEIRAAMSDAVAQAVKEGVCLDTEAPEVTRRMNSAKDTFFK